MGFKVGEVYIGGQKTVVIAEAGVNHLKRLDYAEELVKSASESGVDIVKFQTYNASKLTTKDAPRFWNWDGERKESGSQFDSYDILATYDEDFTRDLIALCKKYKVEFMSTPFDIGSAGMLERLGSNAYKIASGDITNIPLLRTVASFQKPIFLSTGASNINEISYALNEIYKISSSIEVCIMHCNLCYPSRPEDANLSAIKDLERNFPNLVIGLSDHTIGPVIPAASIMYGVKVIEKHFTFDNNLPDSADHWLSINPQGMKRMVEMLRELELAVGTGYKSVLPSEEIARKNARRSLVVNGSIKKGEKFTSKNVICKRPGIGISPIYFDDLIGLTSSHDLADDQIIMPDDVLEDAKFKPITNELIKKKLFSHE